jgi:hypothetical protein
MQAPGAGGIEARGGARRDTGLARRADPGRDNAKRDLVTPLPFVACALAHPDPTLGNRPLHLSLINRG